MYFDSISGIFQNESLVISDEMFPLNRGIFKKSVLISMIILWHFKI